jgi:hypothetical protein
MILITWYLVYFNCDGPVCRDRQGVLWVNDSKATNVDATLVGLKGIVGRRAVVLLGGLAKVATSLFMFSCEIAISCCAL